MISILLDMREDYSRLSDHSYLILLASYITGYGRSLLAIHSSLSIFLFIRMDGQRLLSVYIAVADFWCVLINPFLLYCFFDKNLHFLPK